ncbi:MAG: DUF2190 family protein [Mesorhizobium sp.]|nr:hypothetical protein [Mesorhizobium sp.]MBN9243386.1 DUF2190 family protein [Mesorhizobium sp.]
MNPFVKTFLASAALVHRQLVVFTANDGEVAPAASATGKIAGVVDQPGGAASGGRVDVVLFGPAEVVAGGTIAAGDFITADADGNAVVAAPAAAVNNVVAGRTLAKAVDGDIVKAFINPGSVQGAA